MMQLQNVPHVVIKSYKRGEITSQEAMRELCKHGFANYGNDEITFEFYLNNIKEEY